MQFWGPVTLGKKPRLMVPRFMAIQLTVALLVCLSGPGQALRLCSGQAAMGWAQEGATVRPDPLALEIEARSTSVVNILVEDVTDLYGFEFQITFDPTLVGVVDADPAKSGVQIQPGDFLSPDWELDNTVDNQNGTIDYALSQWDPSPPKSGSGVLAIITWRGKVPGTSPIHFTYVQLGAPGGVPISASTQDGQISVEGPFKTYLPIIRRMY